MMQIQLCGLGGCGLRDYTYSSRLCHPEQQVWLQSKLSSCHGCGSGMIGLNPSAGDDAVTTIAKGICHQELKLSNLISEKKVASFSFAGCRSPYFPREYFLSYHLSWWRAGTLLVVQEHPSDGWEWDEHTAAEVLISSVAIKSGTRTIVCIQESGCGL